MRRTVADRLQEVKYANGEKTISVTKNIGHINEIDWVQIRHGY